MGLRTFLANVLADLKFSQANDQPWTEQKTDQQRGQGRVRRAERNVLENVQYSERRPEVIQRI